MAASTKSQTTATSKSSKKVPMAQQPQTKLTGWKLWVGLVLLLIGGLGLFMGQSALWISSAVYWPNVDNACYCRGYCPCS